MVLSAETGPVRDQNETTSKGEFISNGAGTVKFGLDAVSAQPITKNLFQAFSSGYLPAFSALVEMLSAPLNLDTSRSLGLIGQGVGSYEPR